MRNLAFFLIIVSGDGKSMGFGVRLLRGSLLSQMSSGKFLKLVEP